MKRVVRHARFVGPVLLLHTALLAWSAARHSPVWEEPGHLVAGISHWRFGRFDLMRVNPPLVRAVAGIPVCLAGPKTNWSQYDESVGARSERSVRIAFVTDNGERLFWLHTLARWTCIPISLVGAYVCFCWARDLYGETSGLAALVLWCFSPTILGHAQLITPDAGAAALGVAAGYAFWRWLKRPDWAEAFVAGVALGLALLTKTTWILLFGLWPLVWLVWRSPQRRVLGVQGWLRQLGLLGVILILALYVLNLGYGFNGSLTKLGEYRFVSEALGGPAHDAGGRGEARNRFVGTLLDRAPVPLPSNYVMGIDLQKWDFERKMWSYLRGEWRRGGWWYYYLYALAIKAPLGTWVLVLLALVAGLFVPGYSASWRDELMVLAPLVAVLTLVSSQTGFNHHMRYVLPILPFAFVWTSKVARAVDLRQNKIGLLAAVALAWSVGSSLWIYPHSVSYFNEVAGGPTGGHAHLGGVPFDSNLDWGQDLLYLKRWLDQHPQAHPLGLAYTVPFLDPQLARIESTRPPVGPDWTRAAGRDPDELGPKPGWYALSVNAIRSRDKKYAYFLNFEPVALSGYSTYLYHITLDEANRVRRQLGLPALSAARGAAETRVAPTRPEAAPLR